MEITAMEPPRTEVFSGLRPAGHKCPAVPEYKEDSVA